MTAHRSPTAVAAQAGPARSILQLRLGDPRVAPLLAGLLEEYTARYGDRYGGASHELTRFPAEEFAPPHGTLLIVREAGESVAGGAFRRFDARTAEFKRIWTHAAHRRRGLARAVLAALESEAIRRGYARVYLTTGPRQPEAVALYLTAGYTPLFDLHADPETIGHLAFEKHLGVG
ncbi:GNAT family N-acetyltransferase [Sinomonas sp. JGH33]|uniref:GNAT family N-acetyltransferase n=1 Tax=Sinomonas terricola TaxID=3110330 RepID=A0ABU5T9E4_9MICC|nr:GNAT family N-acetyltransferase [Sinomonas sp. JGH33]MEA5456315.1 GNAT family N-acetyltransferase [Sinomonas sp. JGH33]